MSTAIGTLSSDRTPLEESIDWYVDALGLGKIEWLHEPSDFGDYDRFACSLLPKKSIVMTRQGCLDDMPMMLQHAPELITAIAWTKLEIDVLVELAKRDVVQEERLCWREAWEKWFPGTVPPSERFRTEKVVTPDDEVVEKPYYQSYCHMCGGYTQHTREPYQPSLCVNRESHGELRMRFPDESGI